MNNCPLVVETRRFPVEHGLERRPARPLRLLVLIPHGNIRALIMHCRAGFFRQGWLGAYSFPAAAPLALLARPLSAAELAAAARALRRFTGEEGRRGCIPLTGTGTVNIDGLCPVFGLTPLLPALAMPDGALRQRLAPVLCLAALPPGTTPPAPPLPAPFSLKSCALANMVIRPLGSALCFAWSIGCPAWLPRYREKDGRGRPADTARGAFAG